MRILKTIASMAWQIIKSSWLPNETLEWSKNEKLY